MTSFLQQLNNESLLLMYLADELPAEDRAEVEQMLASSSAMRDELEALRSAYAGATDALRNADKRERMPISSNIAARRVGRAVQAWHARRLASPRVDGERFGFRMKWWMYPLASTAAVVLVIVAWWSTSPDRGPKELKPKTPMMMAAMDDEELPATGDVSTASLEGYTVPRDEGDAVLDETEEELYAIAESQPTVSELLLTSETDEQ